MSIIVSTHICPLPIEYYSNIQVRQQQWYKQLNMALTKATLREKYAYRAPGAISKPTLKPVCTKRVSNYQHLRPLPDILEQGLKIVFVGFNPGVLSAQRGHRFAHPSNRFWRLLGESQIVPSVLLPEEDITLPRRFSIGFTELVMRPTKSATELSLRERAENVPRLATTINKFQPKVVCLVGKGIWDAVVRHAGIRVEQKKSFEYGLQEQLVFDCKCFVLPSTSGLVRIPKEEMLQFWTELKRLYDND